MSQAEKCDSTDCDSKRPVFKSIEIKITFVGLIVPKRKMGTFCLQVWTRLVSRPSRGSGMTAATAWRTRSVDSASPSNSCPTWASSTGHSTTGASLFTPSVHNSHQVCTIHTKWSAALFRLCCSLLAEWPVLVILPLLIRVSLSLSWMVHHAPPGCHIRQIAVGLGRTTESTALTRKKLRCSVRNLLFPV